MPVGSRLTAMLLAMTSVMAVATGVSPAPFVSMNPPPPRWGSVLADLSNWDSSSESHVPQSGHLPIHLEWVEPQDVQTKMVRVLAMGRV